LPFPSRNAAAAIVLNQVIQARIIATALLLASGQAMGGPPFLTDDPVPPEYRHSELNLFSTYDETRDGSDINVPAMEFNYGALPDTQLHIGVPYVRSVAAGGPNEQGIGDVEIGVKYRFIHETDHLPQVAVYPMAMLPTGDSSKGLGNGETWWRLPVWLQKSWSEWTTYGGGGYAINRAEGQKNYAFGGWLLQRTVGDRWQLGGEAYARGQDTQVGRPTTVLNFGGSYRFTPDFNLLFSAGHSVSGETHTIAYLGFWWGFGGAEEEQRSSRVSARGQWSLARQ
jgi:hypothetical protein